MKNLKFYIAILLLSVALGFVCVKWYQQSKKTSSLEKVQSVITEAVKSDAKLIAKTVGKTGNVTSLFDVTDNKSTPAQTLASEGKKDITDTTAMALDIRTKQLQEIQVINVSLFAENLKLKRQVDQLNRPYYTYNKPYLNLKFTPPDPSDSTSEGTADVSGNVKLTDARYWKRKWFLGEKRSILAITSDNPIFKINDVSYLEYPDPKTDFSLTGQLSSDWNKINGVGVGGALRLKTGKLNLEANYQWYGKSNEWMPGAKASIDIFRIGN